MFVGCVCCGFGELLVLIFIGIFGGGGFAVFKKFDKKKHGVHGDKDCKCDCHEEKEIIGIDTAKGLKRKKSTLNRY